MKNATTDERTIRRWFAKEPHANLAWVMGGPFRLIGVDIDPRSGGDASLCDLVEAHGDEWLETLVREAEECLNATFEQSRCNLIGISVDILSAQAYRSRVQLTPCTSRTFTCSRTEENMTKKAHRRFLLAAMMLLLTLSLAFTGPAQQAAMQETCDECNARCETLGDQCRALGYPFNVCMQLTIQCSSDCLYGVCTYP